MARQTVVLLVMAGLFGLAIGSFLNVVIYRLPRRLSLSHPPSHCPRCGHGIGPAENVPVISWLWLRGRCRHCRQPIPVRYPLVEGGTAGLFALTAWAAGAHPVLVPLLLLQVCGVIAAGISWDGARVPSPVAVLAGAAALALGVLGGLDAPHRIPWAVAGGLLGPLVWRAAGAPAQGALLACVAAVAWTSAWLWPPAGLVVLVVAAAGGLAGRRASTPAHAGGAALASMLCAVVAAAALGL